MIKLKMTNNFRFLGVVNWDLQHTPFSTAPVYPGWLSVNDFLIPRFEQTIKGIAELSTKGHIK